MAYDTKIAGIVSSDPGVLLGNSENSNKKAVALAGSVPVFATTENGAIMPGDWLTSSNKEGYAMKCQNEIPADKLKCFGTVIGKALEPLVAGEGRISAFVALK